MWGKLVEGRGVIVPSDREDELLYRISEKRYVLVYWIFIDPEIVGPPWFPWADRELTPEDASLWCVLNEIDPPAPLKRVPLRDPAKDPSSRLNRDWKPQDAGQHKPADASEGSESEGVDARATIEATIKPVDDLPKSDLTVAGKATAAAYELHKEGKRVSVAAVARRAGVDRSHLYEYPEVIKLIKTLDTPDRIKPKGWKKRDGSLEAKDDEDHLFDED